MTPADPIILTISRGEKHVLEAEGHYDIWTIHTPEGTAVSIRNCITDEIVVEGLQIEWIKVSNPFVDIQTQES